MSVEAIVYLVILLGFLIGSFIFFIIMDLKKHKKQKNDKVKSELEDDATDKGESNEEFNK